MRNLVVFIITGLFWLFPTVNRAGNPGQGGPEPPRKLEVFTGHASSHKLYLHFNKSEYNAGEVIWFNGYLLNSVTHLPDTNRTNIYVDLINSNGVLMEKRILLAENGVAEGDISLPLTFPDGNYMLRAYTGLMRNFGEEFFFTRYFYIGNNKYEDIIPRPEIRSNRRFNRNLGRMADRHNIVFFPEGGELVQGVSNRVAFKAVDALGRGMDAMGVVVDGSGNEVVKFSTLYAGMGSFELTPEPGSAYMARVEFNGQRPQVFDLPAARTDGVALKATRKDGNIILDIGTGLQPGDQGYSSDYEIIGHTRGSVIFTGSVSLDGNRASVVIPGDIFPRGIAHFTIFSENVVPVAERLVFIDREDSFVFSPRVVKLQHEEQEYLGLQVEVADINGNPVDGQFSMSVLAGGFDPPGSSANILSNILLSSDLKGMIEDPQYYLDPSRDMETELDHLMMTHGWRRFDWKQVLAGELPGLEHSPSTGISLSGKVTDPAKDESVPNYSIRLKVLSGHNDDYDTRTDGRGNFVFEGLDYPDDFRVELSGQRLPGNYPPEIELNTGAVRGFDYTPGFYTMEMQVTQRGRDWKRVPDAGRSPYAVAPKTGKSPQRYGIPDQTIFIDRDKVTQRTVYDVLVERAQGLQVYGNQLMFRGPTSINLSSEPMFMLDGVQTSKDNVLSLSPREIERIELFRGTSAAMFGVRGGAGVIIAYTRQAGDPGFQDTREYMITGYHSPREFYSDFILTSPISPSGKELTKTVHWEPDILKGDREENIVLFPFKGITGRMKIVIEGVGSQGGIGAGEFTIELQ